MIKAQDLIKKFEQALNEEWGYIYGETHTKWTQKKQDWYATRYQGNSDRKNSCIYGGKWVGHWVTDCSGLFHWAFQQLGGDIAHGSNSIWDKYCTAKGTLDGTSDYMLLPGTAVFTTSGDKHNHIGLYIGNGLVIEAANAHDGVIKSHIAGIRWTAWGRLKDVEYQTKKGEGKMAKVVLPTGAKGNTVNMREGDSKNYKVTCKVPVGAEVDILEDDGDWCYIDYDGETGWMMSNYLEYDGQDGEAEGSTVQVPRDELKKIYDQLGDWLR